MNIFNQSLSNSDNMKMFYLLFLFLGLNLFSLKQVHCGDIETALTGVNKYLEDKPCFTIVGSDQNPTDFSRGVWSVSQDKLDSIDRPLDMCGHVCCDYQVIIIYSLSEINPLWNQFHMYLYINMNEKENPEEINIIQNNVVLFQKRGKFFGFYEKKRNMMEKISVWDGNSFRMNPKRRFEGETLRVGSTILPLFTEVYTLPNGTVFVGEGLENVFMKAITKAGGMELQYVDVLQFGKDMWGGDLGNGSFTGLLKVLLELTNVDATNLQHMCGYVLHPHLICSNSYNYDGVTLALLKEPPAATWMGLITPYHWHAWLGILALLLVTTLVLGTCNRLSLSTGKFDWPLHFLDALNPMAGRPMCIPGFNAAHLGGDKKILGFEVFLITYSLACVVINTGYEGNLKSHLMAEVKPKLINSLVEFVANTHLYKELATVNVETAWIDIALRNSSIIPVRTLPDIMKVRTRKQEESWGDFHTLALEGIAIVNAKINLEYEIRRTMTKTDKSTDIYTIPDYLYGNPFTLHLARMNRFNELLNHRMTQWFEAGMFAIDLKWGLENIDSILLETTMKPVWEPLVLDLFRGLFGLYAIGVTLAFFAYLSEAKPNFKKICK